MIARTSIGENNQQESHNITKLLINMALERAITFSHHRMARITNYLVAFDRVVTNDNTRIDALFRIGANDGLGTRRNLYMNPKDCSGGSYGEAQLGTQ